MTTPSVDSRATFDQILIDAGVRTLIVRLLDIADPGSLDRHGALIERLR